MKNVLASLLTVLVASASALATDLVNQDSKKYEVKVHVGVGTNNISIDSTTTRPGVCSSECTVEVVGVGKVKITGKEKAVVIKNGSLSVVK